MAGPAHEWLQLNVTLGRHDGSALASARFVLREIENIVVRTDPGRVANCECKVVVAGICARPDPYQLLAERLRSIASRPRRIPYVDDGRIRLAEVQLAAGASPRS